jgi:hypothetical protein
MPTRKQRRRRAKEQRHEYEFVVVDGEGHEVEVDPGEIRTQKEKARATAGTRGSRNGRAVPARDARGRRIREAKPPSWRRAIQRAALFAVALFVLTSFLQKNTSTVTQVAISAAYGLIGIPFFYFLDRTAYHRWLRATGREAEIKRRR